MERLSPRDAASGKDSVLGSASDVFLDGGDDHIREYGQPESFSRASSHRASASKPAIVCNDQGHENARHVQHQRVLCWEEGCDWQAEAGAMSRDGEIDLFCSYHQSSDVITTRTANCHFTGCLNTPKYGQRRGPLKFCQHHKRAGMYTNRNGQILLATRDGSAFEDEYNTGTVDATCSPSRFAVRNTADFGRTGGEPSIPSESKFLQSSGEASLQRFTEHDTLGPNRAQDKATPSIVGVMAPIQQSRKTCEVTGCSIQPSYGPSGTSRPRFCATHKKLGMVGLKNRPCIHPGCSTRPHYGLLGCRPIYCAKHKEPNMVHLLKEATIREKMDAMRDSGETITTPPQPNGSESKRLLSRPKEEKLRKKKHKKNATTIHVGDDPELDSRKVTDAALPLPLSPGQHQQDQDQDQEREAKGGTDCWRKMASSIPILSSLSTTTSTPSSSNNSTVFTRIAAASALRTASTGAGDHRICHDYSGVSLLQPEKASRSRLAHILDMAPPFEIQIDKDIRKSAQARATTSGSGRRARVPSRKALEASGKLKNEGIQWLTKEMKEEEARRMRELRAQRKAAAAVGLKAGQVIEAATIDPTVGGGRAGDDGGHIRDGDKAEASKVMWRKLSPSEILEAAAVKSTTNVLDKPPTGGRGQVTWRQGGSKNGRRGDDMKAAISGISGETRKEIVWTPQDTARAITPKPDTAFRQDVKIRKEAPGDQSAQTTQATFSSDGKESRESLIWASTGNYTRRIEAGNIGGMEVCQFEDCARKATFGVNNTARYCKLHALFGMHRINVLM